MTLLDLLINYLSDLDGDRSSILSRACKVKDRSLSNFEDCSKIAFEIILLRWIQFVDSNSVEYIQHNIANKARAFQKKNSIKSLILQIS